MGFTDEVGVLTCGRISAFRAAAPRPPALGFPGNRDPLGLDAARDFAELVSAGEEGTELLIDETAVINVD